MIGTAMAILGAAAIGAGANIAASSANAGAAKGAAATNAAAIAANQEKNTGLIDAQKQTNADLYGQAEGWGTSELTANHAANADVLANTRDAQVGVYNAANDQNQANADTLAGQGRGLFQGNVDRGNAAGDAINKLLGIGGDATAQKAAFENWTNSVGYQFSRDQGLQAAQSSAAAQGTLNTGGTLKALQDRGTQVANTYFGNYLSGLQTQQGTGLSAANALSGVYSNVASLKNNSNTATANGLSAAYGSYGSNSVNNNDNFTSGLVNLQTGANYGLAGMNTGLTNNLVSGNTQSTNAMVGNTNNALNATVSSNNSAANAVSGLAGNLATGYGYSQGMSSYGSPNALSMKPSVMASSYQLPASGGMGA